MATVAPYCSWSFCSHSSVLLRVYLPSSISLGRRFSPHFSSPLSSSISLGRRLSPHFSSPLSSPFKGQSRAGFVIHFSMEVQRLFRSFGTRGSTEKNKALVEYLQSYGMIKSKKVVEVMETIDRGLFVPDGSSSYADSPLPIGYNATISAPHMHGTCLELLKENLQPGMHALDVGSGTGYLTACFAMMVGPQGRAIGVEHIPELVASSIESINKSAASSLLKDGSISVHVGDGRLGWPAFAPYDAIHVGAAADEIPHTLIEQLKPGGRMVIPVGNIFQDLLVVDKKSDGSLSVRAETSVRYVPLTSRAAQLQGY